MTPENHKATEFSVTTFMCEGVKSQSKMAESFNYRRPLSWEKSRAAKRLIVFKSPSEGRKWVNGRDNWAADSWVGYGLLCFSTAEKGRWPGGEGGERKGKEAVWKARVMRCSRRGRLALLGKRRTSILFNPWGDPWPLAYSRLHQVQALTAGSSCTHCKLIFHTLCKHWGRSHMKMWIPFHLSTPPSFFFFMPFYCQGLKLQPGWEGGASAHLSFSSCKMCYN